MTAGGLAACAGPSGQYAGHGNEFFSVAKYGPASPRVVADGDPVPRGGGQYLVGHPYTVAGRTYYPRENESYSAVGMASWYGDAFQGRRTANGEIYDMRSLTAAHPTMPLPSYARVTNLVNGYSIIVRVNDRGPYRGGRIMDVSSRVADVLDFKSAGHGQGQGRICRPGADRGLRRRDPAREPAHRWRARLATARPAQARAGFGGASRSAAAAGRSATDSPRRRPLRRVPPICRWSRPPTPN